MLENLGIPMVILIIIAMNVLFSIKGFEDYNFFQKYKFEIGALKQGDYIRILTSSFLHGSWTHLIFNMLTLYFFGGTVIAYLGTINFVLIYVAGIILGGLFSFYFNKDNNYYSAIGASDAVTAILYAAILFIPNKNLYLYFAIPIPAWLFGIGYLLYSIYGMKSRHDNIGHDAHFGGAVAGYVLTLLMAPSLLTTSLWIVILLAIPIILLFILHKIGKI